MSKKCIYGLKYIEEFDCLKNDMCELIRYIKSIWAYADQGYFKWNKRSRRLELHTAGWSANEEIIKHLRKNRFFFTYYWMKSERGGHYYFKIPKNKK
jgi:hypothetical protein